MVKPQKSKFRPEPVYRFKMLCQAYFQIGRAYEFWESYLALHSHSFERFTYEKLQQNPAPYFESIASHFDVPPPASHESPYEIQRDDTTPLWRERFLQDIQTRSMHPESMQLPQPLPGWRNALGVMAGKPAKIPFWGLEP